MAVEVSNAEHLFSLPFTRSKPDSDKATKPVSEQEKNNMMPSINNPIVGESSIKIVSESTNGILIEAENSSTPTKTASEKTGNILPVPAIYSTPPKATPTPDQSSPLVTKSSPAVVGKSDSPIPNWLHAFWFSYIHDLESIWWVLIWTLLKYQKAGNADNAVESNTEVQKRILTAEKLFHSDDFLIARYDLLTLGRMLDKTAMIIPIFFEGLVNVAAIFREKLASAYKEEEEKSVFPIKLTDNGSMHRDILMAFRTSAIEYFDVVCIDDESTIDSTTGSNEASSNSKRSICEDSTDERPSKRARY